MLGSVVEELPKNAWHCVDTPMHETTRESRTEVYKYTIGFLTVKGVLCVLAILEGSLGRSEQSSPVISEQSGHSRVIRSEQNNPDRAELSRAEQYRQVRAVQTELSSPDMA